MQDTDQKKKKKLDTDSNSCGSISSLFEAAGCEVVEFYPQVS